MVWVGEASEAGGSKHVERFLKQPSIHHNLSRTPRSRGVRSLVAFAGAAVAAGLLTGCESDSFFDPSVVGRWEHTPTKVPILERIASIEDAKGDLVEYSSPTPEDLYTDPRDYRVGPGDLLQIEIWDFIETGRPEQFERVVDPVGTIELPQLGRLFVSGQSVEQARDTIAEAMKRLVADPLVGVVVKELRQQTFTMVGAVDRPGPYFIPSIDYKLLEAVTAGGRIDDNVKEIFVIRQVALDERAMSPRDTRRSPLPSAAPRSPSGQTPDQPAGGTNSAPPSGESLMNLIDSLSGEAKPAPAPAPERPAGDPPVALPDGEAPTPAPSAAPSSTPSRPTTPPIDLPPSPGMLADSAPARPATQPGVRAAGAPIIDLPEPGARPAPAGTRSGSEPSWIFIDGRWVQVAPGTTPQAAARPDSEEQRPRVIAQRVIRIPYKQLLDGDTSLNIVIRPGDTIRVPSLPRGEIYIAGQVARPGVYNISETGRLTLLRALQAASGGLSNLAIPERVDLVRVVGDGQQAMIRLDLRAIAEGTQPDVYLKPDDLVNVGTNFWALPLAVIRNGFRANYGFGLVIDRNFGSDIFGVPPESAANRGFGF